MTEEEYRAHPGVNKSTLWEIRKSPLHYKWLLDNPAEDTPALAFGRLVHMAVLQPEEFDRHYAVAPDGIDRRTNAGKAAWAEFISGTDGKEIISALDYTETTGIVASIVASDAERLLAGSQREVPMFWKDVETGLECKCRVDAMKETNNAFILMDLKTTPDASTDSFMKNAIRYGYHVQAAHYVNGVLANGLNNGKPIEWWFIAVEKKAPYAVHMMKADQFFMDCGQLKLSELMQKVKHCTETGIYPGYETDVITAPEWAIEDEEE